MPITKSAKKAQRSSLRNRIFNLRRKAKIDNTRKNINKLLKAESPDKNALLETLNKYYSYLDKAVKSNFIHKNKSSRLKSRMLKRINKATSK